MPDAQPHPSRIGPYPVSRELGRGGMGIVYLARDTRLDRSVAIKVVSESFAGDAERRARFEREARLLASLHHPNIAAVYGLEEDAGRYYLVMEYVPGETLADRLMRGPLPVHDAIDVCAQVATGLEAAHESGVIHRDLKPGNVRVLPSGEVKVLDFGLAKGVAGPGGSGSDPPGAGSTGARDLTHSPTMTFAATGVGIILGTAGYMSPEQARGKPLDRRTDIWSFGCLLYECLTGRIAFPGETVSDTIAKILEREPDWSALPAATPPHVRALLRRCLEKDARRRLRDIGDARLELTAPSGESAQSLDARSASVAAASADARNASNRTRALRAGAAVAALLAAAAIGMALGRSGSRGSIGAGASLGASGTLRLAIPVPDTMLPTQVLLTPDGSSLVVAATPLGDAVEGASDPRIFLRRLDSFEWNALPGTERVMGFGIADDSRSLLFRAPRSAGATQTRIARIPLESDAAPVDVMDWPETWGGGAFLPNGDIVAMTTPSPGVVRVSLTGTKGDVVPIRSDQDHQSFQATAKSGLPMDRAVLADAFAWTENRGYRTDVVVIEIASGEARTLVVDGGQAQYFRTGHLLFTRNDILLAAPFDLEKLALRGEPVAIQSGLRTPNSWSHAEYDLSENGTLVYAPGGIVGANRTLSVIDTTGTLSLWTEERRPYENDIDLSSDGRRVACVLVNRGLYEIWISEVASPALRRIAYDSRADCFIPRWSANGEWLAYARLARDSLDGVYLVPADGSQPPFRVVADSVRETFSTPQSWSHDDRHLVVRRGDGTSSDLLVVEIDLARRGFAPKRPLLATRADERSGQVSPDGRWLAYVSNETGRPEVYVRSWRSDGTVGPASPVTSAGGDYPAWIRGGAALYYVDDRGTMIEASIAPGPAFAITARRTRQTVRGLPIESGDIMPDGRAILILRGDEEQSLDALHLVTNFHAELERRVPVR